MSAFVRFVRRRGWSQATVFFMGVATLLAGPIDSLFGGRWGNGYVLGALCVVGVGMIILAGVCFFIGPGDDPPDDPPENPPEDPSPAEEVARVGLEVPPDTPVRLPDGVPPDTTVQISSAEDLRNDERDEEGSKGSSR